MEESMTCVSFVMEGSDIAFASYDEERNDIMVECARVSNNYDGAGCYQEVIERFLAVARPNLILVGNKNASDTELLHALTSLPPQASTTHETVSPLQSTAAAATTITGSIPYQLLKSGAFDNRKCRALILQKLRVLDLIQKARFQQQQQQQQQQKFADRNTMYDEYQTMFQPSTYHSLATVVDFESQVIVKALGSLISFLQNTIFRLEEGGTVTVSSIVQGRSSMFMRINTGTLQALHIFSTEHHPLMAKGHGHTKEGFSIFSLLDRTKSKMGRHTLREWMLKPLINREAIQARHDGIELFLRSEFHVPVGVILNLLEEVGAIDRILHRLIKVSANPMDFVVMSRTLLAAVQIVSVLQNDFLAILTALTEQQQQHDMATLDRYRVFLFRILDCCNVETLRETHERIKSIIDEELTAEMKGSVAIRHGFHDELDTAKDRLDHLDDTLLAVGTQLIQSHPELMQLNVIFVPQVGFLTSLDKSQHAHVYDAKSDTFVFSGVPQDFNCTFVRDDKAYFKNESMTQLDLDMGDLDAYIKDTESMIISELEDDILDCEVELRGTFLALAQLDCILAFAGCAHDLNFRRPTIVDASVNIIEIKKGRHPLQELILDTGFVPNETSINIMKRINVITGPNFSGKSCYTRQVGVIVYLAHIGSFLPCESATISITDQILARISTVETCSLPQSSFQLDLTQMGNILRRSTSSTLVLIDEFGKGTNPASGISVLTAALRKLADLKCKVVCTTHFLEIFSLEFLRDGHDGVAALQMAVQIAKTTEDDNVIPLFRLQRGVAESSAGLVCAETAGVHRNVVSRAKEILAGLKGGRPVHPAVDVVNPPLDVSQSTKDALAFFLEVDTWVDPRAEDLQRIIHYISQI